MSITNQQMRPTHWRSRQAPWARILWPGLIALAVTAVVSVGPSEAGGAGPEIVARVNGEAVTRAELQRVQVDLVSLHKLQGGRSGEEPVGEELESLAIENLIRRHLLLQEADRRNIRVSEDEFDQALTELRQRFEDLESFGVWMKERGLDDRALMEAIRADVLAMRVRTALTEGVEVSREQVEDYYASHKEDLTIGEEVRLRIIVVKSAAAAREILEALREGKNFSRLARQRSLGKRAEQGGDTGWVNTGTLPPPLRKVVDSLQAGEASQPLQKRADEFLIIGLQERRPLRPQNLDESRPLIEQRLLAASRQNTVEKWLSEQEQQADIVLLTGAQAPDNGTLHARQQP